MGGQALNLWAERYSHVPELALYGPYTSKDLDYFGHRDAAEKLAKCLGGRVLVPSRDDATPQSAIVVAELGGEKIQIDFLKYIKGVPVRALADSAAELVLTIHTAAGPSELALPVMHPLHCLQSRIANVVELKREDDVAARQLAAAPIVVREYISEMLDAGDHPEATRTLQRLFEHLRSDINGRVAHRHAGRDPAEIIDHFASDERLDARYREHNIAEMQAVLRRKKCIVARMTGHPLGTG
ncbi:MAG TPA: hypothetical protein VF641_03250 [Methylobacterium sp.]